MLAGIALSTFYSKVSKLRCYSLRNENQIPSLFEQIKAKDTNLATVITMGIL